MSWLKGADHYIGCLVCHLVMPLLPLGFEYFHQGSITAQTASIPAAMYSVSIGVSSEWFSQLSLGMLLSFTFAVLFGLSFSQPNFTGPFGVTLVHASVAGIALVFLIHGVERLIRHVLLKQPFFQF